MPGNKYDPRPQAQLPRTKSGPNEPAPANAYVDPALTVQNGTTTSGVPTPLPLPSGSKTLGSTRATYAPDMESEIVKDAGIDNSDAVPVPQAPNSWPIQTVDGIQRGRDLYRNHGAIGQDAVFENQGGDPPASLE